MTKPRRAGAAASWRQDNPSRAPVKCEFGYMSQCPSTSPELRGMPIHRVSMDYCEGQLGALPGVECGYVDDGASVGRQRSTSSRWARPAVGGQLMAPAAPARARRPGPTRVSPITGMRSPAPTDAVAPKRRAADPSANKQRSFVVLWCVPSYVPGTCTCMRGRSSGSSMSSVMTA